jgi:hypothetical protein
MHRVVRSDAYGHETELPIEDVLDLGDREVLHVPNDEVKGLAVVTRSRKDIERRQRERLVAIEA